MSRFDELTKLVESFKPDFDKFYDKGNKTAGVRLRKDMQTLRALAMDIRNEVQSMKRSEGDEADGNEGA